MKCNYIAIDIGGLNTRCSYCSNKKVDLISSPAGKRFMRSVLQMSKNERQFGDLAVAQINTEFANTVSNISKYVGEQFDNFNNIKVLPLQFQKFKKGEEGLVSITVGQDKKIDFTIEECLSTSIKSILLAHKNEFDGVIYVAPTWWTNSQINVVNNALEALNLQKNTRIIKSSFAQALDYIYRNVPTGSQHVLLGQSGHNYSELSLINITKTRKNNYEINLLKYNYINIAGEEVTNALINFIEAETITKYKRNIVNEIRENESLYYDFIESVDKTKCQLSQSSVVKFQFIGSTDASEIELNISRDSFYTSKDFSEIKDIYEEKFVKPMLEQIKGIKIDAFEMLGGNARIPNLSILFEKLGKMYHTLNMDEAEVEGAGVYALSISTGLISFHFHDGRKINWGENVKIEEPNKLLAKKVDIFSIPTFTAKIENVEFKRKKCVYQNLNGQFDSDGTIKVEGKKVTPVKISKKSADSIKKNIEDWCKANESAKELEEAKNKFQAFSFGLRRKIKFKGYDTKDPIFKKCVMRLRQCAADWFDCNEENLTVSKVDDKLTFFQSVLSNIDTVGDIYLQNTQVDQSFGNFKNLEESKTILAQRKSTFLETRQNVWADSNNDKFKMYVLEEVFGDLIPQNPDKLLKPITDKIAEAEKQLKENRKNSSDAYEAFDAAMKKTNNRNPTLTNKIASDV